MKIKKICKLSMILVEDVCVHVYMNFKFEPYIKNNMYVAYFLLCFGSLFIPVNSYLHELFLLHHVLFLREQTSEMQLIWKK